MVAQSVGTPPGEKVPLPGEVGYGWAERLAEWIGFGAGAAPEAPHLFAAVLFAMLIWVFARRCRTHVG